MVKLLFFGCLAGMAASATRFGAVSFAEDGLMPRNFLEEINPLAKRADVCGADTHSCRDVRHENDCCPNTTYCYINDSDELKCCPLGSPCRSRCQRNQFRCYQTSTLSATRTASGGETPSPTVTRILGCCGRACPDNKQYKCPTDQCCPYGYQCGDGDCISVSVPQPSQTGLVRPIQEGCQFSNQTRCDDGEGCCTDGYDCVKIDDQPSCSPAAPTDSNVVLTDQSSNELSDGEKAGIAIGTVFGAGLIIAALTWLCIRRRNRRRQTATQQSASVVDQPVRDNMTELTASTRPPGRGLPHGYFGADAVAGPYTDMIASTAATSPNPDRGVPSQPQSPRDIAMPVEIDSRAQSPESMTSASYYATPMDMDGRYELHGASPVPYAPQRQRSPSLQHTPPAMTPRDELP